MPIAQHFQFFLNLFKGKANSDDSPEDIERSQADFLDSQNMRNTSLDGEQGAISKIHGEVIKWPNIDNRCSGGTGLPMAESYQCIGSYQILGHIIEFWADELNTLTAYVRVDGWIVLMPTLSSNFPISTAFPPQLDGNDSCVGGEIFYTDFNIPPFIFNVTDLLTNSGIDPATNQRNPDKCTQKYFSDFLIASYQIQPPSQADHPVFIEVMPTGATTNSLGNPVARGSGGMRPGMYQYAIQYVDSTGNTGNWSELTPQIPLPSSASYTQPIFPSTKVYGGDPGTVSTLGIHVRFRVTNTNNYATLNIRRVSWDVGSALGSLPNDDSVIATLNLNQGQVSIIDFYDNDNATISPITQAASTQSNLSAIQAAKGIRYYQSKLTLWNIKYASRNLSNSNITFNTTNGTMYPFVRPLGQQGYKDIWNDVYRKSYFRGERYGFALVGFDNTGNPSFAIPIPGSNSNFPSPNTFKNFQFPNRRDVLQGPSLLASTEVYYTTQGSFAVPRTQCANKNSTASSQGTGITTTYEVFDQFDMVQRDPSYVSQNAMNPFSINGDKNTDKRAHKVTGFNSNVWSPFHPYSDGDINQSFAYLINTSVNDGSASDPSIGPSGQARLTDAWGSGPNTYSNFLSYNPKGFLPNMYALGMILDSVGGLPNWCSAFAIVRTAPANRVVAQGQSFYNLNPSQSNLPLSLPINKDTNGVLWDSPDVDTGISNPAIIGNNPGNRYSMQFVSSVGFFSEVFHGWATQSEIIGTANSLAGIGKYDREIDMISYCRILYEPFNCGTAALFNPILSGDTMWGSNLGNFQYTTFDSWRNAISLTPINPNQEIVIASLNNIFASGASVTAGSSPRRSCYYLKSGAAGIYATGNKGGSFDYQDANIKLWHEPQYVINIVDDSQNISSGLIQDYFQTGTFIKVSSIIGQVVNGSGIPYFYLVDERWQDCMPAICPLSQTPLDPLAGQDRYVWIQDSNNDLFAWLNVTYKSAALVSTIIADIANNGFYLSTKCDGSTVKVYGIFTQRVVPYTSGNLTSWGNKLYQIIFDQVDNAGNPIMPNGGDYVIVKYDTCAPIEIFGGDTYIGDYTYPIADCSYTSDANPSGGGDEFIVDWPSPYRAWQINENTYIVHDNDPVVGSLSIQADNLIRHKRTILGVTQYSYVRQYLVNGIVESRTNTALLFNNPQNSNDYVGSFYPDINYVMRPIIWRKGQTNLQGAYKTVYGNEDTNWNYGGFRINPQHNIDYSQYPTQDKSFSMPTSGFTEQLTFCSRALWSNTRTTNEQNSPNLKNFPSTNIFDFDDATGGINRAWDSSNAGQQGNLYAFTETGVVMAETNKSILTSISGGQLAEIGNSENEFIQAEVWLSRSQGMPDQMWRSAAEYANKIYWADKQTVYRLENNRIEDIGSLKYSSVIKNVLGSIGTGYTTDVTATWVQKYQEYWLCVNPHRIIANNSGFTGLISTGIPASNQRLIYQDANVSIIAPCTKISFSFIDPSVVTEFYLTNNTTGAIPLFLPNTFPPSFFFQGISINPGITLRAYWNGTGWAFDENTLNLCHDIVWAEQIKGWGGQYKYRFDKYVIDNSDNIYAQRLGATWSLDEGFIQNGNNIPAWVLQSNNPKEAFNLSKEFIRIRVSSNFVPDNILFYENLETYLAGTPHSILNGFPALKNYGGNINPSWEGYVPRGMVSPFYRNQGRYSIYQVFYSEPTEWYMISAALQFKILK